MSEPLIVCQNLVKIFKLLDDVEILALQGLDLEVQLGEMVGVVGASGSGKSTLLNVLGGLVRPTAGTVTVNGQPLLKLSNLALDRYRRDRVGFVWQQSSRNLIPYLNATENVEYPLLLAGTTLRKARRRATTLLELVGLGHRLRHRPAMLSGGEQARVAIAVALANEPDILLADEPTGELDSVTSAVIYDVFKQLNRDLQLTTLIVSHDPGIATHVDRVIAIRDGKLAGETVRSRSIQRAVDQGSGDDAPRSDSSAESQVEETFEELIVLDSAGRLQIPRELREELNIGSRVVLEKTDDGVLVKPIEIESNSTQPVAQDQPDKEANKQNNSWFQRWRSE